MSNFILASAFGGLAAMAFASRKNPNVGRVIYWLGAVVVSVSAFFIGYPQGPESAIGVAAFTGIASVFIAYIYTPFLKLGERTFSFYTRDKEPYGGGVTIAKSWWRVLIVITLLAFGVLSFLPADRKPWLALIFAISIGLISAVFGYRDADCGNPIAGGQRTQFILISVITAGAFALIYLGAYYSSRQWVLRRQTYGRHDRRRG